MRNPNVLLPKVLFIVYCFLFIFSCKPEVEKFTCRGYEEYQLSNEKEKKILQVPYECNQIILEVGDTRNGELEKFLVDTGFVKVDSCKCSKGIELWEYKGSGDIDVNGVVKNPPPTDDPDGVGRIYPNFKIDIPEPIRVAHREGGLKKVELGQMICGKPSRPVKIAFVDTGVDSTSSPDNQLLTSGWKHAKQVTDCPIFSVPDYIGLNTNQIKKRPVDIEGHGTFIQGITLGLAAEPGSRSGIPFEFINIKFTADDTQSGDLYHSICAMYFAMDEGAQIINCSWGYKGVEKERESQLLHSFLEDAQKREVLVIASMGNDTTNLTGEEDFWPASYAESFDNVISVGASSSAEPDATFAIFSNRASNEEMSISAWGEGVPSAFPSYIQTGGGGSQGSAVMSGTSMSAPFVTLTAGVMLGIDPSLKPGKVKDIIMQSASEQNGFRQLQHKLTIEKVCSQLEQEENK